MINRTQQGVLLAVCAYSIWALAAVYFKALDQFAAIDVLAHRVLWSFILTLVVIAIFGRYQKIINALTNRHILLGLLLSTLLIGMNWGIFIWAVQENQILSASLGYYINPLINILLGTVFLGEKLDRTRRWATGLCVFAVLLELISFGSVPLVALLLAISFAFYGLVRKKLGVDSFTGLAIETAILCPIAVIYLAVAPNDGVRFIGNDWQTNALLVAAGPVTMVPLLCFVAAANRISLSAMGFFQYIAPTGMLLLAVFVYGEAISVEKLTTFLLIWCALVLLASTSIREAISHKNAAQ